MRSAMTISEFMFMMRETISTGRVMAMICVAVAGVVAVLV